MKVRDLEWEWGSTSEQINKERLYRIADLYWIETRYKRLDNLQKEVDQEVERRQNILINKNQNNG